jgi:hypothetical protein
MSVVFGQIPHLALLDVLLPTVSPVHICWLLIEEILAFLLLEEHLAPSIVPLALPWPYKRFRINATVLSIMDLFFLNATFNISNLS